MRDDVQFILDSPGDLSPRAQRFLRAEAHRSAFEVGLVGDELRKEIVAVYGRPNEDIVRLLDVLQARYGGLSYRSGFFDADVIYSPACEPEDAEEELEVLYVVQTGTPAGVSVRADSSVVVGFDELGVVEFRTLDALIECDSLFAHAALFPSSADLRVSLSGIDQLVDLITSVEPFSLRPVLEANGMHTHWFASDRGLVFLSGIWREMGFSTPLLGKVWGADKTVINYFQQIVGS